MKYIDRINSFWDYATMNPLSTGQVSLYFALLHICNRSYWTEWFQAPNQVLSILTGLSRSGILKARNELKQRNLIDFKERGTKGTLYKLLDNVQDDTIANSAQDSTQNGVQNSVQDSVQDSTIANSAQDSTQNGVQNSVQDSTQAIYNIYNNIHNKDKRQKTEDKRQISFPPSVGHFEEFWSAYPRRQRRSLTENAYCDLVMSKTVTEEALVKSAENYAEYIKIKGIRNLDMCYLPNNFLKDRVFEDFLPENYQKPECAGVGNNVTNLTQSQMEQIEKLSQERNTVKNEHPPEVMY